MLHFGPLRYHCRTVNETHLYAWHALNQYEHIKKTPTNTTTLNQSTNKLASCAQIWQHISEGEKETHIFFKTHPIPDNKQHPLVCSFCIERIEKMTPIVYEDDKGTKKEQKRRMICIIHQQIQSHVSDVFIDIFGKPESQGIFFYNRCACFLELSFDAKFKYNIPM